MSLPQPEHRQKEVLYLSAVGHHAVLGTAGSGKTTMAIHRAVYLANRHTHPGKHVLLVTFNNTLIRYMEACGRGLVPNNLEIRTFHRFAFGYLSKKLGRNIRTASGQVRLNYIQTAIDQLITEKGPIPVFDRPIEIFASEFEWLSKTGIISKEEYIASERVGRVGTPLSRKERPYLFDAFLRYKNLRRDAGYDCDYDDVGNMVLKSFEDDHGTRYYQHIIIDEGQDFSPVMLKALTSTIPENGSLTFFGDVAQQIYGTRISWRSAGLRIQKVWEFRENYRNSKQIARLGLAIASMPYFQGVADMVEPREPKADGPLPAVIACPSIDTELEFAIERASYFCRNGTVAILLRTREHEGSIKALLRKSNVSGTRLHKDMPFWQFGPGIFYGTYHSAKGLEFDSVILPLCNKDQLPSPERITELGDIDDAMSEEGRLLYVAVTRAKNNLLITYSGELTSLVPVRRDLYQKFNWEDL